MSDARQTISADTLAERERCAVALEVRAGRILAVVCLDRVQQHSRALPTEAEIEQARYAARQLTIAADELRAGFHAEAQP